ncbi:MAG: hypothetical protein ACLQUY_05260 [Ktedonobacterales bacterium]
MAEVAALALISICNDVRGINVEQLLLAQLRRKVLLLGLVGQCPANAHKAQLSRFLDDKWLDDSAVDRHALTAAVEQHLQKRGVSPKFAQALSTRTLRSYLESMSGSAILIPPKGKLLKDAVGLLTNDFARSVFSADIKQVTLLLDDFYYLVRNTDPKDREDLAAELRSLSVSGSIAHFSVQQNLFTWIAVMHTQTAPRFRAAWEARDMHKVAPLSFDAATSIVLHALPVEQGPAMLETYLTSQRVHKVPNGPHPYTAEALTLLVQIAADDAMTLPGTYEPRTLLQIAHHITSRAIDLGFQAPIGVAQVKQLLNGTTTATDAIKPGEESEQPNTERPLGERTICPCACHDEGEGPFYDVIATIGGVTGNVLSCCCSNCMKDISSSVVLDTVS